MLLRLLTKCEIEPGRFHDLRHTWATKAIEAGANPVAVQQVLGHANLSTTSRYSHATDKGTKEAVNLIEFAEKKGEVVELPAQARKRS